MSLHSVEMGYGPDELMKMLHVSADVLLELYGVRVAGEVGRHLRVVK